MSWNENFWPVHLKNSIAFDSYFPIIYAIWLLDYKVLKLITSRTYNWDLAPGRFLLCNS